MTSRDRTVLMVVVCAVLAAASWFLLIAPKRAEVKDAKAEVVKAQVAADSASSAALAAETARDGYDRDYAAVVKLGKAIPVEDDVASLVYQLEDTAKHAGVDFRAVNVTGDTSGAQTAAAGESTLPGGVTEVPITLTFDGGYFAMTKFLRNIDRFTIIREKDDTVRVDGRLIAIDSVKLTPGRGGFPNVSAEVSAKAYRAPLVEVEGSGTSAEGSDTAATASTGAAPAATPAPASGGGAQ